MTVKILCPLLFAYLSFIVNELDLQSEIKINRRGRHFCAF